MVGMALVSCLERWDELGSAETFSAAGLRVAPSRAGGSKSGGKLELC